MSAHVSQGCSDVLFFFFLCVNLFSTGEDWGHANCRLGKINLSGQIYVSVLEKEGTGGRVSCQKLSNSQGISAWRLFSISVEHNEASFSITKHPRRTVFFNQL